MENEVFEYEIDQMLAESKEYGHLYNNQREGQA